MSAAPRIDFASMLCECGLTRRGHMGAVAEDHTFEPVDWPRRFFGGTPEPFALAVSSVADEVPVIAPEVEARPICGFMTAINEARGSIAEAGITVDSKDWRAYDAEKALEAVESESKPKLDAIVQSAPKRLACSKCKTPGHNARTCRVEPAVEVLPARLPPMLVPDAESEPEGVDPEPDQDEDDEPRAVRTFASAPAPVVSRRDRFAAIEAAARARSGGR